MKTLPLIAVLLFCFLNLPCLKAQSEPNQLLMISRSTTDSIQLRWAPGSFSLWQQIRAKGLQLNRQTMMRDGKLLPLASRSQSIVIAPNLRPAPLSAFEVAGATDDHVAIGGQAIYGESFLPNGGEGPESLESMINRDTD